MARSYHAFNLAMYFKVSPQCHAIHSVFISNRHKTIQVKRMHFIQLHTWQDKQEQEDTRRLFHKKNNRRLLSQTTVNSNGGWEREFHYIIMLFIVTHEYMHCCDDNIYDCCDEWGDGFRDCRGRSKLLGGVVNPPKAWWKMMEGEIMSLPKMTQTRDYIYKWYSVHYINLYLCNITTIYLIVKI